MAPREKKERATATASAQRSRRARRHRRLIAAAAPAPLDCCCRHSKSACRREEGSVRCTGSRALSPKVPPPPPTSRMGRGRGGREEVKQGHTGHLPLALSSASAASPACRAPPQAGYWLHHRQLLARSRVGAPVRRRESKPSLSFRKEGFGPRPVEGGGGEKFLVLRANARARQTTDAPIVGLALVVARHGCPAVADKSKEALSLSGPF